MLLDQRLESFFEKLSLPYRLLTVKMDVVNAPSPPLSVHTLKS